MIYSASFSPFGNPYLQQGRSTSRGFTGEFTDPTGLSYLRARYMDPITGTFLSKDPVMGVPGFSQTFNPYIYTRNNPTNLTDPTGELAPLVVIGAAFVIGALVGGAFELGGQIIGNLRAGKAWDCNLDMVAVGVAMLEGGITGAISAAFGFGPVADFAFGMVWDMVVHQASFEEALWGGVFGMFIGGAVNGGAGLIGKGLARGARSAFRSVDNAVGGAISRAFRDARDTAGDAFQRAGKAAREFADTLSGQCSAKNSFSADTPVSTADGDTPIADLEIGDFVLAYDPETGDIAEYEVTNTISHTDEDIIHLYLDGELIETTADHPFYTDDGTWVNAADLSIGEQILSLDGDYGTVELVIVVEDVFRSMYNLTIADVHTFAVGERQWVVHNCDLYRGDGNARRVQAAKDTGYLMSDAVFNEYNRLIQNGLDPEDALDQAITYGYVKHKQQIAKWGSLNNYADQHAKNNPALGANRTMISFFTLDLTTSHMNQIKVFPSITIDSIRNGILNAVKGFRWKDNLFRVKDADLNSANFFDNRANNPTEGEVLGIIAVPYTDHTVNASPKYFRDQGLIE